MIPANAKQGIKWTAKMQEDVLECKRRALHEFNQSCQNGKRRGYVKRILDIEYCFGLKRDMVTWV